MTATADCPLVLVEWLDSRQPLPGWQRLAEFAPQPACACLSVGWLLCERDGVLALAPNLADVGEDGSMQAAGILHVPRAAVVRVTPLREVRRRA